MALTAEELKKLQELAAQTVEKDSTDTEDTAETAYPVVTSAAPTFTPSDTLTGYQQTAATLQSSQPEAYQSQYQEQIDSLLNDILNRKTFSYDMNADPLYQKYKAGYTAQGKKAMRDTMGQAAALTGGYGNSYATVAGNQAYQDYLAKADDMIPDLYAQALNQYTAQGSQMASNLAALQGQESTAYAKSQDDQNAYNAQLTLAQQIAQQQYSNEFNEYQAALSAWQYEQDLAEQQRQAAQAQANYEAENAKKTSSGSGGGKKSTVPADLTSDLVSTVEAYFKYTDYDTAETNTWIDSLGISDEAKAWLKNNRTGNTSSGKGTTAGAMTAEDSASKAALEAKEAELLEKQKTKQAPMDALLTAKSLQNVQAQLDALSKKYNQ